MLERKPVREIEGEFELGHSFRVGGAMLCRGGGLLIYLV